MFIISIFLAWTLFSICVDSATPFPTIPLPNGTFNGTTDPYPPYQPKEYGVFTETIQYYVAIDTGDLFIDLSSPAYLYRSYSSNAEQQVAGGFLTSQDAGGVPAPLMVATNTQFSAPSDPKSSQRMVFTDRECYYNAIEGGGGFQGYDFYTNQWMFYESIGLPLYFAYGDDPIYGTTMVYATTPPDGNITYTLTYQNSTKYLLSYIVQGTEHVCNIGECGDACCDGNPPVYLADYTAQTYSGYKVLADDYNWGAFFNRANCPFDDCEHDDDDETQSLKKNVEGLAAGLAVVVVFSAAAIYYLYTKNATFKPTLGPPRRSPNLNSQPSSDA